MVGLMKGLKDSQDRYTKIQAARQDLADKKKMMELRNKEFDLRVEEMEHKRKITPQVQSLIDLRNQQKKVEEQKLEMMENFQGLFSDNEKAKGAEIAATLQNLNAEGIYTSIRMPYGPGSIYMKQQGTGTQKRTVSTLDKALGQLNAGEFEDREEAERFAEESLGLNWDKKFPEAVQLIDKKFEGEYKVGEIKDVTGKGRYKYIGDNKWKKVD